VLAMEMAAERVALAWIRAGKQPAADGDRRMRQEDREARARAQGGSRGARPAAAAVAEEENEDLSNEQKHIAASMGISEDAYRAQAKKGVAMRGTGGR